MKKLLILLGFTASINGYCQDVYIGDTINTTNINTVINVSKIKDENVIFDETYFSIKFDKTEIIKSLEVELDEILEDLKPHQNKVIEHLKSKNELYFKNIWSDWLKKEDQEAYLSWSEMPIDKLTIHILSESVCNQIESGKFKLKMFGENVSRIYSTYISSDYGGYGTGYITDKKVLFWICPPFVID